MELFPRVNNVYGSFFGTSPPTRACIAVDLPPGTGVIMDCIAHGDNKPGDRQALHVQGISYWASANIGPYSQAVAVSAVSILCDDVLKRSIRSEASFSSLAR